MKTVNNGYSAEYSNGLTIILERFSIIQELLNLAPKVEYRKEAYPHTLRIVGSVNCSSTCILGPRAKNFCHEEGLSHLSKSYDAKDFPDIKDVVNVWKSNHLDSVKIIGIGKVNFEIASKYISTLKELNCEDISITCSDLSFLNQKIDMLIKTGLTRLTVSIHNYSSREEKLLASIMNKLKIIPNGSVKFNWVLLASKVNDLPKIIDWINSKKYTLRLFSILRTPATSGPFEQEYIHWTSLVKMFSNSVERIDITEYLVSNRLRYKIKLSGGGVIEVNMPTVLLPGKVIVASECRLCEFQPMCEEGYLGCGIRLAPDGKIYPCLLRPELLIKT